MNHFELSFQRSLWETKKNFLFTKRGYKHDSKTNKQTNFFSKLINVHARLFGTLEYAVDILWGQPIKLIQVVSTSEFHEY